MVRYGENVKILEWDDINATKFYTNGFLISFCMRSFVYPTLLIKTRLQSQNKNQYKGFSDAVVKIYKTESFRGFYKGLHLNLMQIPMGQLYLTVFEVSKQKLTNISPNGNLTLQHSIAGFAASSVTQSISTPLDVVTQFKQVNDVKNISKNQNVTASSTFKIASQIYKSDGLRYGLYRGFILSTLFFGIHSAYIWAVYHNMLELTLKWDWLREKLQNSEMDVVKSNIQKENSKSISKYWLLQIYMAGTVASLVTNLTLLPVDTLRTRHQLHSESKVSNSIKETCKILWQNEGASGFCRGWQPRVVQSFMSSGLLFAGYEFLKIVSKN